MEISNIRRISNILFGITAIIFGVRTILSPESLEYLDIILISVIVILFVINLILRRID